jgi:hypothetical protein
MQPAPRNKVKSNNKKENINASKSGTNKREKVDIEAK